MNAAGVAAALVVGLLAVLAVLVGANMRRENRELLDESARIDVSKLDDDEIRQLHRDVLGAARALGRRSTREDWWLVREIERERRRRFHQRGVS